MAKTDRPRLAILGAGPVGIEAALIARKLSWPVTVYERGRVGEHLERWGHVAMFTPFALNSTPLGRSIAKTGELNPDDCITGREHVAKYLAPLANCSLLLDCVKSDTQVTAVGRAGLMKGETNRRESQPFRLQLRDKSGAESWADADVVFDCTGVFGKHRNLGPGGLPAAGELSCEPQIAFGVEDILGGQKAKYAGKTVMLVGAGPTAATHVGLLAELAKTANETWVVWLARGPRSSPFARRPNDPWRGRDQLLLRANSLAARGEGNIEFHASSAVERIASLGQDKGFQVTANVAGESKSWDVDRIIGSVGYGPDPFLYRELQYQECPVTQAPAAIGAILARTPTDQLDAPKIPAAALKTTESDYFVLGAKSFGRHPNFVMKIGFEQVREAFAIISGKPASTFIFS